MMVCNENSEVKTGAHIIQHERKGKSYVGANCRTQV